MQGILEAQRSTEAHLHAVIQARDAALADLEQARSCLQEERTTAVEAKSRMEQLLDSRQTTILKLQADLASVQEEANTGSGLVTVLEEIGRAHV